MDKLNFLSQKVLTGDVWYIHQFLSPELGELDLFRQVHRRLLLSMALLGTVDDGASKPLCVHGRDEGEKEPLFRLPVTFAAPSVRHVPFELWDVLDLVPHLCDGELRPLWHLHGRYLV